jgi:hypothetical protein
MSEKKRQKKEGHDKNKINQARRQANPRKERLQAAAPQQAKDESNLNETKSESSR